MWCHSNITSSGILLGKYTYLLQLRSTLSGAPLPVCKQLILTPKLPNGTNNFFRAFKFHNKHEKGAFDYFQINLLISCGVNKLVEHFLEHKGLAPENVEHFLSLTIYFCVRKLGFCVYPLIYKHRCNLVKINSTELMHLE